MCLVVGWDFEIIKWLVVFIFREKVLYDKVNFNGLLLVILKKKIWFNVFCWIFFENVEGILLFVLNLFFLGVFFILYFISLVLFGIFLFFLEFVIG